MRIAERTSPILTRRENLANREARELVGVMYGILALHVDPRLLKRSLDWKGAIENISLAPLLVLDIGNVLRLCRKCHQRLRGRERRWRRRLYALIAEGR